MKKPALVFSLALFIFTITLASPKEASARDPWSPGYDTENEFLKALDEGPNQWNWLTNLAIGSVAYLDLMVNGTEPGSVQGVKTSESVRVIGLVGYSSSALAATYNTQVPHATVTYLASLNPIKPAYAQTGTTHLNFILDLWKVCRNLAYVAMTVILVVLGFMLMFRKKIDPRTEITLVAALPKIVVALILITFSYALAGLMYDATAVTKGLIGHVFRSLPGAAAVNIPGEIAFYEIPSEFGMGAIADALKDQVKLSIPVEFLGKTWNLGGGMLFSLIFGIATFTVMIKLLFALIKYFAQWFLLAATGPFFIIFGALPNQAESITWWLKKVFISTIVFPITYAVLNLALYIKYVLVESATISDIWTPSLFGTDTTIAYAPGYYKFFGMIVCWGLILIASTIPSAVDNLITEGKVGRVEGEVDLGRTAGKIPIIGGFF